MYNPWTFTIVGGLPEGVGGAGWVWGKGGKVRTTFTA